MRLRCRSGLLNRGCRGTVSFLTMGENAVTDRPRVLLIEDDPQLPEMLQMALANEVDLVSSRSWVDAKRRLEEERFGLVIMDLYLPDAGLLEPLEHVHEIDPDYPVLLVSGNVDRDDPLVDQVLRMGAAGIVRKPFDFEHLRERILQCLQRRN